MDELNSASDPAPFSRPAKKSIDQQSDHLFDRLGGLLERLIIYPKVDATMKLCQSSLDARRRRHHTEPHCLKGAKSAWHMIRRSDENAPAPSASFEDCGCVNSIFPRVSAFGFNNQSSIRYTELNQRI